MYFVFGLGIGSLIFLVYAIFYWGRGIYMYTRLDKEGVIKEERDLREQLAFTYKSVADLTNEGKSKQAELNARLSEVSNKLTRYNYTMNIADFCTFCSIALGIAFTFCFQFLRG